MTGEPLRGCALAVSADDLSAWRDGALDAPMKARLEQHVGTCAACRARMQEFEVIAQALRAIPTPEPARGFGRNPRLVDAEPVERRAPTRFRAPMRRRRALGGLGAVAAIALLLLAFTQVFGRLGLQTPLASATKSPTSQTTRVTTATPGESTLPGFQVVSAATAWGGSGLVAHITSTALNANTNFIPFELLPDGSALVGEIYNPSLQTSARLALWNLATNAVTPLNAPSASQPFGGVMTDGRYIVYQSGANGQYLSVYDLGVGAVVRQISIADGGPARFDHGLYVQQGINGGITIYDVATGRQSAFPTATSSAQHALLLAFSWPYLVYIPDPTATTLPGALAVRDLATGKQGDLTPLAPLLSDLLPRLKDNQNVGVAVTNAALFVVSAPSSDANQLYELDDFMGATPTLKPIARVTSQYQDSLILAGADARAVGMFAQGVSPSAYDRTLGKAVQFSLPALGSEVTGHFVVTMGPLNAHEVDPYEVIVYDTDKLPGGSAP